MRICPARRPDPSSSDQIVNMDSVPNSKRPKLALSTDTGTPSTSITAISKTESTRPSPRSTTQKNKSVPNPSPCLYLACLNGDYDVTKTLLDRGECVNIRDTRGNTPLMAACQSGHVDIVELVLSRDVRVNLQNSVGLSALMTASRNGHSDVVKLLIDKGAQVNMQNSNGWSALMLVSQTGHSDVVKLLIDKGAQVNMQNNDGWYALMHASLYGHSDVVKLLLDKGAQINMQTNNGVSALMIAGHHGKSDVVKLLIDKGALIDMQNNDGWSALMIASHNGRSDVVKLLIDKGAQVDMQNNFGETALDIAYKDGHSEIVNILYSIKGHEDMDNSGTSVPGESSETGQEAEGSTSTLTDNRDPTEHAMNNTDLLKPDHHDNHHKQEDTTDNGASVAADVHDLSQVVLLKELKVVTNPLQLGRGLGIERYVLETIEKENRHDISGQKNALFSYIEDNYKVLKITWGKIATILEEFLEKRNLALEIREKFNCQSDGSSQLTTDPAVEYISYDLALFKNESIGGGAFGTVFRGQFCGNPCAIKVLRALGDEIQLDLPMAAHTKKDSINERFRKECEYLESFKHPNVVSHLATRTHPKTSHLVLALELMDCNLRKFFIKRSDQGPLSIWIQRSLCHNIASALAYIHSRGVVHRDLCGDNILLDCRGKNPIAKVCDFGMSRIIKGERMSISLSTLGHRGYLPPEATDLESTRHDSSFDIFSFGAIMVQIIHSMPTVKDRKERTYHLEKISSTHPLKPLIEDCLQENRDDRPSAFRLEKELAQLP